VLRIIVGEGEKPYAVTDDNGVIYGLYADKAEAKQALKDWAEYYGDDERREAEVSG
jgi:hypothetical protein